MYTVVFADDEIELRQAILQRIDWEGLGFRVVADAENGVEALEAVEQHEPDLLITDIRMPLMTGIELARRVREVCPATQIVFLSGYDDFGYAQEAIRYNVISYLLKPISAAELSEELGHIREKMDARLEELRHAAADPQIEKRLATTEFLLPLLLGTSDDFECDEVLYARAAEALLRRRGEIQGGGRQKPHKRAAHSARRDHPLEVHLGLRLPRQRPRRDLCLFRQGQQREFPHRDAGSRAERGKALR